MFITDHFSTLQICLGITPTTKRLPVVLPGRDDSSCSPRDLADGKVEKAVVDNGNWAFWSQVIFIWKQVLPVSKDFPLPHCDGTDKDLQALTSSWSPNASTNSVQLPNLSSLLNIWTVGIHIQLCSICHREFSTSTQQVLNKSLDVVKVCPALSIFLHLSWF